MAIKFNDNTIQEKKKIPLKMDIYIMNSLIGYVLNTGNHVTRKVLSNVRKLFNILDEDVYRVDDKLYTRFVFIKNALEARIDLGFESFDAIVSYCQSNSNSKELGTLIKELPTYVKINAHEIKQLGKMVDDRLRYAFLYNYKDRLYSSIERLDTGDYKSFEEINNKLLGICTDVVSNARKIKSFEQTGRLNFSDDNAVDYLEDVVNKINSPSNMLYTGIREFNKLLSPAFHSNRLYTFLGLPGGFKSGMLLTIAEHIRKYNKGYKSKSGKKPAVYVVLMENDITETVERLFSMVGDGSDIRGKSPKEVIDILKNQGKFSLNKDTDEIALILQFYPNRSIDTQRLYEDIDDLFDDGYEVCALILDYLKRIKPYEYGKDTKEDLKNSSNELKNLAIHYSIPVITAHQLNRSGQAAIDAAMTANKEDLARLLSRANVGEAWEIVENSDGVFIINKERYKKTGQWYLAIKRSKLRYKEESEVSYINHPFEDGNSMKLIPDIDLIESLSINSLASDLEDYSPMNKKGKKSAVQREIVDDPFDFDKNAVA